MPLGQKNQENNVLASYMFNRAAHSPQGRGPSVSLKAHVDKSKIEQLGRSPHEHYKNDLDEQTRQELE